MRGPQDIKWDWVHRWGNRAAWLGAIAGFFAVLGGVMVWFIGVTAGPAIKPAVREVVSEQITTQVSAMLEEHQETTMAMMNTLFRFESKQRAAQDSLLWSAWDETRYEIRAAAEERRLEIKRAVGEIDAKGAARDDSIARALMYEIKKVRR